MECDAISPGMEVNDERTYTFAISSNSLLLRLLLLSTSCPTGKRRGIETDDKWRIGAGREDGLDTVGEGAHLSCRLRHVGARVEVDLHQRKPLYVLCFNTFHAIYKQEYVDILLREKCLHLR
jgi:hypothetical protein